MASLIRKAQGYEDIPDDYRGGGYDRGRDRDRDRDHDRDRDRDRGYDGDRRYHGDDDDRDRGYDRGGYQEDHGHYQDDAGYRRDEEELRLPEKQQDDDSEPELEGDEYTKSLSESQKENKIKEGLQQGALLVMGLLALGIMLIYLAFILEPLVLSRFLLYIFQPFINLLVGKKRWPICKLRFKWPRWLAVTVVLLLMLVIFAILGLIIGLTISDMIEKTDYYKERFNELKEDLVKIAEDFGYTREQVEDMIPEIKMGDIAVWALNYIMEIVPQMILVMIIVVYMLLGYDGSNKSKLHSQIDYQIRTYILIHSMVSVVNGVLATIVLWFFSVDFAVFWGLVTFILNYIPNIGSVLATLLPLPFVVFKEDFQLWELIAVAVILTLLQFVLGQVWEPKLLGNAMEIPAITVIVALLFWGALWGMIGAIFSVPLTVAIRLWLQNIDHPAPKVLAGMIVGDFSYFDTGKTKEQDPEAPTVRETEKELKLKDSLDLSAKPTTEDATRYDPEERYKTRY